MGNVKTVEVHSIISYMFFCFKRILLHKFNYLSSLQNVSKIFFSLEHQSPLKEVMPEITTSFMVNSLSGRQSLRSVVSSIAFPGNTLEAKSFVKNSQNVCISQAYIFVKGRNKIFGEHNLSQSCFFFFFQSPMVYFQKRKKIEKRLNFLTENARKK